MTFKHKLSRRLAMLFGMAAVAALASGACELPVTTTPPTGAAQLVVSPHAVSLALNQEVMFTAVGLTAQGDTADVDVTWSTTGGNLSGTSTSTNGRRHYGQWKNSLCGSYTVSATAHPGGKSDAASVAVTCPVVVGSVTVAPVSAVVPQGQTTQLAVTVTDTSGTLMTGQTVAWTSSNGAVAAVNGSGLVSAAVPGLAKITATSGDQSDTSEITVTSVPVAVMAVTPSSASVAVGATVQLTATPKDASGYPLSGKTVTWASGNSTVATVSQSGLVTAATVGSAAITATSDGQSDSSSVTVAAAPLPVASVAVTPATDSIQAGQTAQLTATPMDAGGNALSGRAVAWASSNTSVATVSASGLVAGVAAGSATITATSEGQSGSAAVTVTQVPVASVTVSPPSASVAVGSAVQLSAVARDAGGNILAGRSMTWSTSNPLIATVSAAGLAAGIAAGSAMITATSEAKSGQSTITVTAAPPIGTGSCLAQSGTLVTLSGLNTGSSYNNTGASANTIFDARTAQWLFGSTQLGTYVYIGGGSGLCWSSGQILAQDAPDFPYSGNYHDIYGMNVHAASATVENVRIFTGGDGITFDDQGSANWTVRGVHIRYMRDDCIENDFLNSGLIDDVLAEGCYTFVSSRTYTGSPDGTNNTVTVQNSLAWLQQMDAIYPSLTPPGSGGFWKWVGSGWPNNGNGPSLVINNSVFRADAAPVEGEGAGEYFAPPKLKSCSNNVLVWLGSGSPPRALPSCFTVMTGATGLAYWNTQVAAWKARHLAGIDVAPPIVALFNTPGTLTGTASLVATAVDDQAIAGVQFKLNGQNIGSEVLPDQVDKARLSWDSRTKANGTYTLTATARDAAGHTKTSAGVLVSVGN